MKESLKKTYTAIIIFAVVSAIIESAQGGIVWSEYLTALVVFFVLFYLAFELLRRKKQGRAEK